MDNYYANGMPPTGSMVAPSNPHLQALQPQKKSHSWLFPCIVGVIIVAVVIVAIIAIATNTTTTPALEEEITIISPDDDVNAYFYSLVNDPDYKPDFSSAETKYSNVPDGLTCDMLKEVEYMDTNILNLYLNAGYVVAISGKGGAPFSSAGKMILIYSGSLDTSTYKTIPIECPSEKITKTTARSTYSGEDIFNHLKSEKHFYVWSETMGTNLGE